MSVTRALLDCLGRDSLVRLICERGLPTSQENDECRATLARSYRGDVHSLINELSRAELVDVFRHLSFQIDGRECYLPTPGKYRGDALRAFAVNAFAGQHICLLPPFEQLKSEAQAVDDHTTDSDGNNIGTNDGADGGDDRPFGTVTGEWSRPHKIARVMRRLGWWVPGRLRTERFQQLIAELRSLGIEVCLADDRQTSVLDESAESPGIAARIRLRRPEGLTGDLDAGKAEKEVDISDAQPQLADQKVAKLGLRPDPRLLYFIMHDGVWAVARAEANQPKPMATQVASLGLKLDYERYIYYIDADGDLANKKRGATRDIDDPTLSLLGWAVIHSDGIADPREIAELQRVLNDSGRHDNRTDYELLSLDAAITVACTASPLLRERLVGQLFRIATADGLLAEEEVDLLKMVEQRLLPGSQLLTRMINDWRSANAELAKPQTRGDQLIEDILSILQSSTQYQH